MIFFSRHLFPLFVGALLLTSFDAQAASDPFDAMVRALSAVAQRENVNRIAILEFTLVDGQSAVAGRVAQERFIYAFVKKGEVVVIERDRLETVKRELTLGMTGLLDQDTTKRIGKILGVDALVYGSLTSRSKSLWDVHARLVAVETGKILGAAKASMKKEVLGADPAVSPSHVQGWRIPAQQLPIVSTSSEKGTVIFQNTAPIGSEPQIVKLTLLNNEDDRSVAFDLEYFLPPRFDGKPLWASLKPDAHGDGERQPAPPGQHVIRLECRTKESTHFFSTTLQLIATLTVDDGQSKPTTVVQEWVPFRKIWINESNPTEFLSLRGPAEMKVTGVAPPFIPWKKAFTIQGEFGSRPNQTKKVIIGGPDMYLELKIRQWGPTQITVDSPQSTLGPINPYRLDPDLPYFLAVTSGKDHSNLFYFQFDHGSIRRNE